jgi:glutamine amidotransferase-like uncharacterized protein
LFVGVIYGFNLHNSTTISCQTQLEPVKVLVYDGEGTDTTSVDGIIYCMENIQSYNSNIQFDYETSDVINSDVLASHDVLIMSGGDIELLFSDPTINPDDIKKFVETGQGYVGICAGAYAASNYNGEYGSGWGISPHIECNYTTADGFMPITLTNYGVKTLKYGEGKINPCLFINNTETVTLLSFPVSNTPGLYKNGNYTAIGIYAENDTLLSNYAAILDDNRGSGRIILSGPHPELDPAKPELVARMILWASKRI